MRGESAAKLVGLRSVEKMSESDRTGRKVCVMSDRKPTQLGLGFVFDMLITKLLSLRRFELDNCPFLDYSRT